MDVRKIPEETLRRIVATIRKGAYPAVAAEAHGIPRADWERLMDRGRKVKRKTSRIRQFYQQVQQALAFARCRAEWAVLESDPKAWLRSGPGKEQSSGLPIWSAPVRLPVLHDNRSVTIIGSPEWQKLYDALKEALGDDHEARARIAKILAGHPPSPKTLELPSPTPAPTPAPENPSS